MNEYEHIIYGIKEGLLWPALESDESKEAYKLRSSHPIYRHEFRRRVAVRLAPFLLAAGTLHFGVQVATDYPSRSNERAMVACETNPCWENLQASLAKQGKDPQDYLNKFAKPPTYIQMKRDLDNKNLVRDTWFSVASVVPPAMVVFITGIGLIRTFTGHGIKVAGEKWDSLVNRR